MRHQLVKSCAIALIPSIATLVLVQACGGSSDAVAQAQPAPTADPIEGVWEAAVTQRDCSTDAALATFRGAQVMHRGGTLTDTNAGAPGSRGPGFGVWSRSADGSYAVKFRFYRYNVDGTLAGTNVVSTVRTLTEDGNGYTGVTRNQVLDVNSTVLSTLCVTDVGTRFK